MRTREDMWNNDTEIPNCPEWCDGMTFADAAAVFEGGCASGAWMPAVTYYQAAQIMADHGDSVLEYLEGFDIRPTLEPGDSWAGFACKVLSMAVEAFAATVVCAVEDGEYDADDDDDDDDDDDESENG